MSEPLLFGLDAVGLSAAAASMVIGGIVKGITGIGLPIVVMAVALNFMEPQIVLAMLVMPILLTNLYQATRMGRVGEPIKRFWLLLVFFLVTLYLASSFVTAMDSATLFAVLGVCVCVFTGLQLVRPPAGALTSTQEKLGQPIVGIIAGGLGGVSTVWGPALMVYLMMLKLDKEAWVRSVGLIWFLGGIPLTLGYWQNGLLNGATIWLSLAAVVPGMIGVKLGEGVRNRIDQESFRKILLVCLFLIGLNLIRRAVF